MAGQLPWVQRADGSLLNCETGAGIRQDGKFIYLEPPAGARRAVDCLTSDRAGTLLGQIVAAASPVVEAAVLAPVWTSVTPATTPINSNFSAAIAGSGFSTLNLTTLKADDGSGNVTPLFFGAIETDTEMDIVTGTDGQPLFPVAGVYTIYYSTDHGTTWTTTGLTVTAS